MTVQILRGDVRDRLRDLPDESVHCVVTSPPYWGLRDYGMAGQLGLEDTPQEFVEVLVGIFREVRRVLRTDGTAWVNMGDSYASTPPGNTKTGVEKWATSGLHGSVSAAYADTLDASVSTKRNTIAGGLKPKDLAGMPWRLAFALQADGWWLRQDIIWSKPNPMPESVRDRCTKAHEYIFLLAKSERYYYDQEAIMEASVTVGEARGGGIKASASNEHYPAGLNKQNLDRYGTTPESRNRRSVWSVATQAFSEAHFATFPPALIEPCILAGCPAECCAACGAPYMRDVERESIALRPNSDSNRGHSPSHARGTGQPQRGSVASSVTTLGFSPSCDCNDAVTRGTVLDPFGGAGTTGLVADRLQRNAILIELNPEYADMAERRIRGDSPLFAQVGVA